MGFPGCKVRESMGHEGCTGLSHFFFFFFAPLQEADSVAEREGHLHMPFFLGLMSASGFSAHAGVACHCI